MSHNDQQYIEDPGSMMLKHPSMYRWVQPVIIVLAVWLLTSWSIFSYDTRAMLISDLVSGVIALTIAIISLSAPKYAWITYANAFVGVWLLLAPLVFWTTSAAVFVNDTLIGTFLIAFSFVIPMSMKMPGPDIPPGWSYNPSTWVQRAPLIALGLIGYFLARPMASYQLGHIDHIWDPFFGVGSENVLNSSVSKAFPISDAGLGAATYLIEVLSTFMGDERRWRTMPWMVAIFGVAVIPLGITSIVLVIMQPVVVGFWCTLCLAAAAAMLLMVPLALDEVIAMIQFLNQSRKEGKSVWRTFWHGGNPKGSSDEPRKDRKSSWSVPAMVWGFSNNWGLILSLVIGIWLMFAPSIFQMNGFLSDNSHIAGALVVTIAATSFAEIARPARFLNLALGIWLLIAPWLTDGSSSLAEWGTGASGLLLIFSSLPLGQVRDQYGSFNPWVKWNPLSIQGTKQTIRESHATQGRILKERTT